MVLNAFHSMSQPCVLCITHTLRSHGCIVANKLHDTAQHMQKKMSLDANFKQEITNATYWLHELCVVMLAVNLLGKEGECQEIDMRIVE